MKTLALLALLASSVAFASIKPQPKIVGGEEAAANEFPYIVSIHLPNFGHFCGGSLIAPNWVLTAAHCVRAANMSTVTVYVGVHDQYKVSKAEAHKVVSATIHPNYSSRTSDFDVAVLKLDSPSSYPAVALNEQAPQGMFTTAGWGALNEGDNDLPNLLQKVDVPFVSKDECNKAYPNEITDRMTCAGFAEGGKDSCQGDSGGPLVSYDADHVPTLVGVVSWGEGCARANAYGVYSDVASMAAWIHDQIK